MPRILVLALENWLGAARLPKALHSAGFEVSLLCYPNTLVSLTRYVDDKDIILPMDPAETVARRMIELIRAHKTNLIIPADDRALRFLHHIVEVEPMRVLPEDLVALVRASLPDPASFRYGVDKEAASALMSDLGFKTPRCARIYSRPELRRFVEEVGLPVVLKPLVGAAGQGVQILPTSAEVDGALITANNDWMVQQYIVGKSSACASVAINGECLGTLPYEKTLTCPGETGPATVVTRLDNDEMRRGSRAYAKATRANGFFSLGYMVDAKDDAYFLECNARMVPAVPCAHKLGVDLIGALHARIVGAPIPPIDPDAPRRIALYPQELHRDPNSPYRADILDEPTDDPDLHRAMERGIALLAAGAV